MYWLETPFFEALVGMVPWFNGRRNRIISPGGFPSSLGPFWGDLLTNHFSNLGVSHGERISDACVFPKQRAGIGALTKSLIQRVSCGGPLWGGNKRGEGTCCKKKKHSHSSREGGKTHHVG